MKKETILDNISQHNDLRIRVKAPFHQPVSQEMLSIFDKPVPSNMYYVLFVAKGSMTKMLDFQDLQIAGSQLLFATPWQVHTPERNATEGAEFYHLSFGEELASYFSAGFSFFIDPLGKPVVNLDANMTQRMIGCLQQLENLLQDRNARPELVLIYLNAFLTECNIAYFKDTESTPHTRENLSLLIAFKDYIEKEFLNHPSIEQMAAKLGMNTNALYNLVKTQCGVPPKTYLTNRIMLEAQRKLYFQNYSIKELAYDLNYNDPEYFSRLFKKHTGKSVPEYRASMP